MVWCHTIDHLDSEKVSMVPVSDSPMAAHQKMTTIVESLDWEFAWLERPLKTNFRLLEQEEKATERASSSSFPSPSGVDASRGRKSEEINGHGALVPTGTCTGRRSTTNPTATILNLDALEHPHAHPQQQPSEFAAARGHVDGYNDDPVGIVNMNMGHDDQDDNDTSADGSMQRRGCRGCCLDGSRLEWWCKHPRWRRAYVWIRRCFTWLPGLTKLDNSFLCDQMLQVTLRILLVFLLRVVVNEGLYVYIEKHGTPPTGDDDCTAYLSEMFDFYAVSLPINLILALPALNCSAFQLFRSYRDPNLASRSSCASPGASVHHHESTSTATGTATATVQNEKLTGIKRTWMLELCEFLVILEIPYLFYSIVMLLFVDNSMLDSVPECWRTLDWWFFLVFLATQALSFYAYVIRWWQVIVFHRLHDHLLSQRGFWRGNNRFQYDGQGVFERLTHCCSKRNRQVSQLKVRLYTASKHGNLHELNKAVQEARAMDGPDFACKWYESDCDFSKLASRLRVFGRCRRNPLHVAVAFGQLDAVSFLIQQAHFPVNGFDKIELFHMDISSFYHRMFDFFFVWFRNSTTYFRAQTRSVFGSVGTLLTPLHIAVSLGNTEMAKRLVLLGANGDACAWSRHQRYCTPPLFWAVSEECVDLLSLQCDVNHLYIPGNGFFNTAYESARMAGNHAIADRLQSFGGDMALTPLHDAAAKGDLPNVEFYLKHGGDPNSLGEHCTSFFRRTPLHWAAMRGHEEVIKLLIEFGARVDCRDRFGRTPLAYACFYRRIDCIHELLLSGADPNARDTEGWTNLAICAASPVKTVMRVADTSAGQCSDQRTDSCSREHLDVDGLDRLVQLWKQFGGDLNLTCQHTGDTALHVALRSDHEQAAIVFVRHGMSLTASNTAGQRAIDCAQSTSIRYAVKKEAGYRDVMLSYCHAHAAFAWKVRDSLAQAHITTWMDQMDPTGITGGAIWRQEIAQAINNSTMMLCILCEHYPNSQWCMKELAYAKITDTPVLAIKCSEVEMTEELQMYLYTRQIIDFKAAAVPGTQPATATPGVLAHSLDRTSQDSSNATSRPLEYDETIFQERMKLLLDGIHAETQKQMQDAQDRSRKLDAWSESEQVRQFLTRRSRVDRYQSGLNDEESERLENKPVNNPGDDGFGGPAEQELDGDISNGKYPSSHVAVPADIRQQVVAAKSASQVCVFITHGGCHESFCRRLRAELLRDDPNHQLFVVFDAPQLVSQQILMHCDVLVVVLSALTIDSAIVMDQLAFAEDHFKVVVPVLLSLVEVNPGVGYTFARNEVGVHHFNESLGFQQSLRALGTTLTRFGGNGGQVQGPL